MMEKHLCCIFVQYKQDMIFIFTSLVNLIPFIGNPRNCSLLGHVTMFIPLLLLPLLFLSAVSVELSKIHFWPDFCFWLSQVFIMGRMIEKN